MSEEPAEIGELARRLVARIGKVRKAQPESHLPATDEEPDGPLEDWQQMEWARVIPVRFREARLDDLSGKAGEQITEWAGLRGPKPNLILTGPIGCGKSHAAVAVLRPAFERSLSVALWPTVRLLRDLSADYERRGAYEAACCVSRLVIDDLDLGGVAEWRRALLSSVIDSRWTADLPTIVTTNADPAGLAERLDPRAASRLLSDATIVALRGKDRRMG